MNIKYKINGQSLRSYCLENGLPQKEYARCKWLCLHKYLTPEEALKYKNLPKQDNYIRCKRNHRRFLGYTEDELDLSTEEIKELSYAKRGVIFYHGHTIGWWAKQYNISKGCIYYRIKKMGMNILEAVQYTNRKDKIIKYKGKSIYKQFDKKTCNRITQRVNYYGWSIEDAINTPPLTRQQINKYCKTRSFGSLKEIFEK